MRRKEHEKWMSIMDKIEKYVDRKINDGDRVDCSEEMGMLQLLNDARM